MAQAARKVQDLPEAAKKRRKARQSNHADDLSFMRRRIPRGSGIDYWVVSPTFDSTKDTEIGRILGEEFMAYVGKHPTYGNGCLLGDIVREMMDRVISRHQPWNHICREFLHVVMANAMTAAHLKQKFNL